jgi:dipeptidyl aminopeptidase/acylaminoacyl peptidase
VKHDLRDDPIYRDTYEFFERVYAGSFGSLSELWDIRASSDGRWIAVSGTSYDGLTGLPRSRIAVFDATRRSLSMLGGARNDTGPRWSPDSQHFAFLSDREVPDRYAPYIYDPAGKRVQPLASISASAESVAWAPDAQRLLVQSVGGPQQNLPDWMPEVEESVPQHAWRRLWICSRNANTAELLDWLDITVWEAVWCGNGGIVAVVSDNPREAAWFKARLAYVDLGSKTYETIYSPSHQIGLPAASPDGRYVAIVEGCLSDRGVIAGDVVLLDRMLAWRAQRIDMANIDVTSLCANGPASFTFAGVRDFEVAAGEIAVGSGATEIVATSSGAWMRLYPAIAPLPERRYATVAHTYVKPPALVTYSAESTSETLYTFSYEGSEYASENAGELIRRSWTAPDGLEIHGYVALPGKDAPRPLVTLLHGGPVWTYANTWCLNMPVVPLLVKNGYAVFLPNPRGSSGRGQTFTRLICGDLGGAECTDVLSGIRSLVHDGIADETRLAAFGGSHGGYLVASLVERTDMFAAAICAFPVTDVFSGYLTATPSEAMPHFIKGPPFDVRGQFFTRSPIMHANDIKTPVLVIAGAQDRTVGVTQGLELHRALAQRGAQSELVTYPLEGHGVQNTAAYIDYCTRILHWFNAYLISGARSRTS